MKPVVLILTGLCAALTMTAVSEELSPEYQEGPHPVQGLDAFMERHGEKPYDLFLRDEDSLATHRLIFQDKQFATDVLAGSQITAPSWFPNGNLGTRSAG